MKQKRPLRYSKYPLRFTLFFPIAIFYMELVLKIYCFKTFSFASFFYTLIFTIPLGLFIAFISSLWSSKINRRVSTICMVVVTIIVYGQALYYTIFKTFFTLYSFTATGEASQYWREALAGVVASLPVLFFLLIPLAFWIFFKRGMIPRHRAVPLKRIFLAGATIITYLLALLITRVSTGGILSVHYLYSESFIPDLLVSNFGAVTTMRLDASNLLFGTSSGGGSNSSLPTETDVPTASRAPVIYEPNVLEIDFDSLIENENNKTIKEMHEYFKNVTPSLKNEYTGAWKGKNLIWICGEGFSCYAVDKELTPTLYKLAHEGFVFNNFYNPIWGVSTSDGEYTTLTSLIPKSGIRSFARSAENSMPFCMGNQLSPLGYTTLAYHDHTYSYYGRDKSHPNMGYTYKGVGNGLEVKKTWPESDLEMVNVTLPEFIDKQPFHVYYMTVSGHLLYTFTGNAMSKKNQDLVKDLPYSESVQAYMACNIELDRAVEALLDALEEKGILENTAIVLSGDHYPYGLEWEGLDALNEIAGHKLERTFEMYKTTLIMWSGDMKEPVIIDKPCSALDVLPTVSNLMGIDYDSRLLMGTDILSNSPRLVVFSNRSWITDYGRYDSTTGEFMPNEGQSLPDDYAASVMKIVNNKFDYSKKILENDYYSKVLPSKNAS